MPVQQPAYYHNVANREGNVVTVSASGAYAGFVNYFNYPIFVSDCSTIESLDESKLLTIFIFHLLKGRQEYIYSLCSGAAQPHIYPKDLLKIKIPLPPLDVQKAIVAEIDSYQKIIDGARQVVENYKPTLKVDPEWEMVRLGNVCEKITDGTHYTPKYEDKGIIFLSSKNVMTQEIDWHNVKFISKELHEKLSKRVKPQINDILLAKNGVNSGIAAMVDREEIFDIYVSLALLRPGERTLPNYLLRIINTENTKRQFVSRFKGVGVPNLHLKEIKEVTIPLPDPHIQQQIVSQIEAEQEIINANKKLIEIYEQKIKEKIAEVWGE